MMNSFAKKMGLTFACVLSLGACAVGPDYVAPSVAVPAAYKEGTGFWQPADPQDAAPRGAWWTTLNDTVLNDLESRADANNQTLKQMEASYRVAMAVVDESQASLFPTLSLASSDLRSGTGRTQAATAYKASTAASWEPDLWGGVRRSIESDTASAESSAANWASARLSLQAQLATAYINLRATDTLKTLREETVKAYRRSLKITQDQYSAGIVTKADVSTAQTQLSTAETQALQASLSRAQYEHQIAVLVGEAPAGFALAPSPLAHAVPPVAAELPARLLEQRPDIAAAERSVAAANAQIGVDIAAFFPNITLSASYGYAASAFSKLAQVSSSVWSVGPALALTLFDGGARSARLASARAAYDGTVAAYRQTVLAAFQDVEDNLVALRLLADQAKTTTAALQSAQESETLYLNQYKEGLVSYTNVATAQATRETAAEKELSVRQSRFLALIALHRSLGGGGGVAPRPVVSR